MTTRQYRDDLKIGLVCLALLRLLFHALQDVWTSHATEQAKSPKDISDECNDIVFAKLLQRASIIGAHSDARYHAVH